MKRWQTVSSLAEDRRRLIGGRGPPALTVDHVLVIKIDVKALMMGLRFQTGFTLLLTFWPMVNMVSSMKNGGQAQRMAHSRMQNSDLLSFRPFASAVM
jgi:hypothetical protein